MSNQRVARSCLVLAGVGLLGLVGACAGRSESARGIRHDLTPELDTQVMRQADTDNMFWHQWNGNMRMAWDDFYRGALYDRPSRLTRFPSPH